MMKSCKLPLEPRSRRSSVGWSEVVAAAALVGMVDVAIRDTIRAHFGQYPPEHHHTSITSGQALTGAANFDNNI